MVRAVIFVPALLIALAVSLVFTSTVGARAQEGGVRVRREGGKQEGCNGELMKRLKGNCCKGLRLFRNGSYEICRRNITGSDQPPKEQTERFCIAQCVFQSNGLLVSAGTVDIAKMTTLFLSSAGATWQPVVQAAITNCTTQLNSLGTPPTPAPGSKACSPSPAVLLHCIRRHAILNCPAAMTTAGTTCSADLQKLATCDVFRPLRMKAATSG